jgi:hypothetical protein
MLFSRSFHSDKIATMIASTAGDLGFIYNYETSCAEASDIVTSLNVDSKEMVGPSGALNPDWSNSEATC